MWMIWMWTTVLQELCQFLSTGQSLSMDDRPTTAMSVAAIKVLLLVVVQHLTAHTMMDTQDENSRLLAHCADHELFLKYIGCAYLLLITHLWRISPIGSQARSTVFWNQFLGGTRLHCWSGNGHFVRWWHGVVALVELCHGVSLDSRCKRLNPTTFKHYLFGRMAQCSGKQGGTVSCVGGWCWILQWDTLWKGFW